MKNLRNRNLLTATLLLASLPAAFGQNTPTDDAYTNTASAGTNYGTATTLNVVSSSETSFITFDLSTVPTGATGSSVAKASLKLYVNAVTTAGSFNVDYVNGTWSEKTITSSLSPALGNTIAASVPLGKGNIHDYILVDVTSAVVAWLNGSQANDGLALVANSPLSASFDSKENTSQSHPPELDIVFTSGGSGSITGVTAGSGLTGGGTKGNVTLSMLNTCASGQILQWNGTTWACANTTSGGTVTSVGSGAGLTGGPITSTGSLSIANAGVTNNMLQNPSLTVNAGSGLAGGGAVALGGTATLGLLTNCASGQILKWNGTAWACSADANSGGTITGVTAGTYLTGGGTTGNVTVNLDSVALQNANDARYAQLGSAVNNFSGALNVSTASSAGITASAPTVGVQGVSQNVSGAGVYGTTTATGGSANGVQGASTNATAVRGDDGASGSGVVGTSSSGFGVYGTSASGYGFATNSNVQQARGANGWVKAMAVIYSPGSSISITHCFNSTLSSSAASTPPCGITLGNIRTGDTTLDFGFQINDRFIAINSHAPGIIASVQTSDDVATLTNQQVEVITWDPAYAAYSDASFTILIY